MEIFLIILSIFGSLASIVGIAVAVIQTKRLRNLELEINRKTWSQISTIKGITEDLEHDDSHQAIGKVFEQFRFLLREAIMQEKNFSVETINKWRRTGRLSSIWQERQALQLLHTNEVSEEETKSLPKEHMLWDEDPDNTNPYDFHTERFEKHGLNNKDEANNIKLPNKANTHGKI